jgi:plasmid maintenance system antidote protein VapI
MKFELGRCLLGERLVESGVTLDDLSRTLHYKPERLSDFIDNKRVMPLKAAISIADTLRCNVTELYELHPSG